LKSGIDICDGIEHFPDRFLATNAATAVTNAAGELSYVRSAATVHLDASVKAVDGASSYFGGKGGERRD